VTNKRVEAVQVRLRLLINKGKRGNIRKHASSGFGRERIRGRASDGSHAQEVVVQRKLERKRRGSAETVASCGKKGRALASHQG